MADKLQKEWEKLQLNEEEEEVVVHDEDLSIEKKEEVRLSLTGKLLTGKSFNIKGMDAILRNVWKA